jgi:hypothetical protein
MSARIIKWLSPVWRPLVLRPPLLLLWRRLQQFLLSLLRLLLLLQLLLSLPLLRSLQLLLSLPRLLLLLQLLLSLSRLLLLLQLLLSLPRLLLLLRRQPRLLGLCLPEHLLQQLLLHLQSMRAGKWPGACAASRDACSGSFAKPTPAGGPLVASAAC